MSPPLHPKILKMKGDLTRFCVNPLEKFSDFEKVREGASLRGMTFISGGGGTTLRRFITCVSTHVGAPQCFTRPSRPSRPSTLELITPTPEGAHRGDPGGQTARGVANTQRDAVRGRSTTESHRGVARAGQRRAAAVTFGELTGQVCQHRMECSMRSLNAKVLPAAKSAFDGVESMTRAVTSSPILLDSR